MIIEDSIRKEYREIAVELIQAVWRSINWENISIKRRMNIYDELTSKIKSAAMTNDLNKFLEKFMLKWGIRSLNDKNILKMLTEYNNSILISVLREDTIVIVLMLREKQELKKREKEELKKREKEEEGKNDKI